MLSRKGSQCLCFCFGRLPVPTPTLQNSGSLESLSLSIQNRLFRSERHRHLASFLSLLRITKNPQDPSDIAMADFSRVHRPWDGLASPLLRIIESHALRQMFVGFDKLSERMENRSEQEVSEGAR